MTAPPTALLRRAATNRIASMLRAGTIPDVGQFGTGGSLPSGAGPIDPPILTGDYPRPSGPSPGNLFTRMDPGFGQINPSVTINPGDDTQPPDPTAPPTQNTAPPTSGPPQIPTQAPPSAATPPAPLWFQPGYQPSAGIQAAIGRGDYSSAYGQSAESRIANFIADSQRFGGNPNHMPVPDSGRNMFYNLGAIGAVRGYADPENNGTIIPVPVNPNGLPNPITAFLQRLRGGNTERGSSGMLR